MGERGHRGGEGGGESTAGSLLGEPAVRRADVCARRAAVYQALTLGFREPTAAYLEALVSGELVEGLREAVAWPGADGALYEPALSALSRAAAAADLCSVATCLATEYARLFTGPGRPAVMCYATQYLDSGERRPPRLNGAAAAYAAAAYRAEDVAPVAAQRELPDHVTIELEFLYHLCRREEQCWQRGASDEASRLRCRLDSFLREHAARFFSEFAAAVLAATTCDLFEALAELLDAHVIAELGRTLADPRPSR